MKKRIIFSLCLIPFVAAGCSSDGLESVDDFSTSTQAQKIRNFDTIGGEPWGSDPAAVLSSKTPEANMRYGRGFAVGMVNRDNLADIVATTGGLLKTGSVKVSYRDGSAEDTFSTYSNRMSTKVEKEDFGEVVRIGKFCPNLTQDSIIIASAPTYSSTYTGAFGLIYTTDGTIRNTKNRKFIYGRKDYDLAGRQFTVGDIDGDGKNDLIYQSTPMDSKTFAYQNSTVSVVMDFCSQLETADSMRLEPSVVLTGSSQGFGSSIYVEDLDKDGSNEVIVVDNLYTVIGSTGAPAGAIYFYQYKNGNLETARPTLYGDLNASIETVGFSDIDRDGDLDLIVGQPMHRRNNNNKNVRMGRVRTYTNAGPGKEFDPAEMLWNGSSNQINARFGMSLVVADVNGDGADDLVVGAPGYAGQRSSAIYAYMGSNDGKVFSEKPYWSYVSPVPAASNESLGLKIAVADMDGKGWLDIIATAPDADADDVVNSGSIAIFRNVKTPCYTADLCLIDNVCYAKNVNKVGDLCSYCDPSKSAFDWTAVTCESTGNECSDYVCSPAVGCKLENAANGTSCGDGVECSNNLLTSHICNAGQCVTHREDCGLYRCTDLAPMACMSRCETNADCYGGTCSNGECISPDTRPVVVLADYPHEITVGTTMELDASSSYDPDGGQLWMTWWSDDVEWKLVDPEDTSKIEFTAPESAGKFSLHLLVTDDEGLSVQNDIVIDALEAKKSAAMRVLAPAQNAVLSADNLEVSGETEAKTPVSVVMQSAAGDSWTAPCSTISDENGSWQCILDDGATTIPAGDYTITATSTVNGIPASYDVNVHLTEAVSTDENGMLQGGACSISAPQNNFGWFVLFAGFMFAMVPLRRRVH